MHVARSQADAYEIYVGTGGEAPLIITCEHASNRLPSQWTWQPQDERLVDTHWAWDPGAADIVRELADDVGAAAVLSRFTRLLVDPNRPIDAPDLFREVCDGAPVALNLDISPSDRNRRIALLYQPYHDAIDTVIAERESELLLAIHSFTPVYEGHQRSVDVGVLHCDQPELAARWRDLLAESGMDVRIDEPYSGGEGFMYSPWQHARVAGCPALELELRQDILAHADRRSELVQWIRYALSETGVI